MRMLVRLGMMLGIGEIGSRYSVKGTHERNVDLPQEGSPRRRIDTVGMSSMADSEKKGEEGAAKEVTRYQRASPMDQSMPMQFVQHYMDVRTTTFESYFEAGNDRVTVFTKEELLCVAADTL